MDRRTTNHQGVATRGARRQRITLVASVLLFSTCLGVVSGCSSDGAKTARAANGGSHPSSAGAPASAGANTAAGGRLEATGGGAGSSSAAGNPANGGAPASAGSPGSGGTAATAGAPGSLAMGGASAGAGGATPFAQAVENQSADCAVGTLPEASALTQIPKLPDPFLKLDGKRVSSVADQAHCSYKTEYTDLLAKSIAAFLKHTGDAPGQFLVGSGGSLTRSDWIDWQAPTLQ